MELMHMRDPRASLAAAIEVEEPPIHQ